MEERYCLYLNVTVEQAVLEISEERYRGLVLAWSTLSDAAAFEQKYELLLGNYMAFESWAATHCIYSDLTNDHSYDSALSSFGEANRHVMNLLSSSRAYIDQVKKDFSSLPLDRPFKEQAESKFSGVYDCCKEYRFLEALRNHVQHHSPPVHRILPVVSHPHEITRAEQLSFVSVRASLAEDKGFKKSVLAECEDEIDLRRAIRQYVAALSSVHIELRAVVADWVAEARQSFQAAIQEYSGTGRTTLGLRAGRMLESGDFAGSVPVFLQWDDAREKLVRKNRYQLRGDVARKLSPRG